METNSSLRVLLIEDDEDDYILVKELLSESPLTHFTLDWVKSYEAGLDAVCHLEYDAYLLDYLLGEQTGLELLFEASAKGCEAPVILLTGKGGHEIDLEAITAGAADYLVKGEISVNLLERSIRYAMERKKTEQELRKYRNHLEELVQQRTSQLQDTNLRLQREIEERERAEYALRRSEGTYRTLVESSLDIIFTVSEKGIISSLNPAFEKITGWSAEEWVGKAYGPLVNPGDIPLLQDRIQKILTGTELPPAEIRIHTKSGGVKVLEFRSAARKVGNAIIGLIGTARDITDRKKAEEQVIRQNQFLNTILESLSHPFYVVDAKDYKIILANNAAAPQALPPNTKCYTLFHKSNLPCQDDDHQCPLHVIKRSKKPLITEHIHYDRQGNPRHVEVHGYPIIDEQGEVSQIIEYCLDITDRKEMEVSLRKAHDQLENRVQQRTAQLANMNKALLSEIAERRRIEEALRLDEKRLEALLGLSQMTWASEQEIADYVLEQEVRLTSSKIGWIGFLDEDEKDFTLHAWSCVQECRIPEKTGPFEIEKAGVWADAVRKRMPILVNDFSLAARGGKGLPLGMFSLRRLMSIPIFEGDRVAAVAIVANKDQDYDQSDVRQLTLLMDGMWKLIQRERSVKAMKDTENLAGIGGALSSVAHDMKTPLVAIGGFTKLVQSHLGEKHPDWAKMQIVLKETERLEKMVKDMLDFSKPLELDRSEEEIAKLIHDSLEVAKPFAEKNKVALHVETFSSMPLVSLDRCRIEQVIINLLTNAIQASSEGQDVKVRCRSRDTHVIIDVVDSGPGIPADLRKEIFSPFFTTKKEGTGLGLPIVRKIVEAHHGRIEILDNLGNGVTFRVVLPVA